MGKFCQNYSPKKIWKDIFLLILLFLNCISGSVDKWIRELPNLEGSNYFEGRWERKSESRASMTSSWHTEKNSEYIEFNVPEAGKFTKVFRRQSYYGAEKIEEEVTGIGSYKVSGNWLLLFTEQIKKVHKEVDRSCCNEFNKYEHKLLYFWSSSDNLIIPMKYESGYTEYDFGVKDGVTIPYDAEDKNFKLYINIYSFKEYHSHAYFKSGAQ